MPRIVVRFMSLTGPYREVRSEPFSTPAEALKAVEAHAAAGGYTDVKVITGEDDDLRYTARTPGGRRGRNIAYGEYDIDESF